LNEQYHFHIGSLSRKIVTQLDLYQHVNQYMLFAAANQNIYITTPIW